MISRMGEQNDSAEYRNLWAPWRIEYIRQLAHPTGQCFLCDYAERDGDSDAEDLILWRGQSCMAVMNRFPYTSGHLLVAPYRHVPELSDLDDAGMLELMQSVRDAQAALREAFRPDGFNIGINLGKCAGAGLPGHLHVHVVPRWEGDTNFMPVFGNVRVIPEAMANLYRQLRTAAQKLHLPRATGT